ncbi:MAG: prepilin-type N-terminal cleavage/methylation domain-containing protein [Planctomycetota bacterium]
MKHEHERIQSLRSRAGFSLVEVLVALMIVSGIMLALTQLL